MQIFYLLLAMVLSFGTIFLFRLLLRKKRLPLALRILTPIAELFFSLLFAYLALVTLPSIAHFIFAALIGAFMRCCLSMA